MDYDPGVYEKTSFDAQQPALDLIKLIKVHYKRQEIDTIVDIGCGPGNTAKMLAQELNVEHIVGIDIDPKMIEFAKHKNMLKNTDYYTQDISCDWNEWNDSLRQLEGKVSVIFSNYSLHWLQDRQALERTTHNSSKLLSNSGIIVMNILFVGDIYRTVSSEERLKYEQWLRYPTEEEVIGLWVTDLKKAGFTQFTYTEPKCIYPELYYVNEFTKMAIKWFKCYLKQTVPEVNIDHLIRDLIIKDRARKLEEKSSNGEDLIEIRQQLWTFVI